MKIFLSVLMVSLVGALYAIRRYRFERAEASRLDGLIRPFGKPEEDDRYRHIGHDEKKSIDAAKRRQAAAERRLEAARIESGAPAKPQRIQLVG